MDRSRFALYVLLAALAGLLVVGGRALWPDPNSPARMAARLIEAKGYTLGRQVASDLPGGGEVILLSVDTGVTADERADRQVLSGLAAGCGSAFRVRRLAVPAEAPDGTPEFLRQRAAGHAHLAAWATVRREYPDCVAVVARLDPLRPLPPPANPAPPPLYGLGSGEEGDWRSLLAGGRVRAVQIDHLEGQARGGRPADRAAAAEAYYRVLVAR